LLQAVPDESKSGAESRLRVFWKMFYTELFLTSHYLLIKWAIKPINRILIASTTIPFMNHHSFILLICHRLALLPDFRDKVPD
jgi:hypothetical protein